MQRHVLCGPSSLRAQVGRPGRRWAFPHPSKVSASRTRALDKDCLSHEHTQCHGLAEDEAPVLTPLEIYFRSSMDSESMTTLRISSLTCTYSQLAFAEHTHIDTFKSEVSAFTGSRLSHVRGHRLENTRAPDPRGGSRGDGHGAFRRPGFQLLSGTSDPVPSFSRAVHEERGRGRDVPVSGWDVRRVPLSPCKQRRVQSCL